jgi:flagellar motor switch protein FliM
VARNVPLRIGTRTIAHGTIGALDERVAVQITQAFSENVL